MTAENRIKQPMSRRQFIRAGTTATAGLLLAACMSDTSVDQAAAPTQVVAQPQPTNTPPSPTSTSTATNPPPMLATGAPTGEPTPAPTDPPLLEPTPQCDDHDETPAQTEGPFYSPDTPARTSLLEDGVTGTKLIVSGRVLTTHCEPVAGAILDFWQADDHGEYDNVGYRLRGHQFTDADGNYHLETIVPGLYPGRTRHIHVKVQGPNTSLLTTQLYFPNEPANQTDGIFQPALVMDMRDSADGKAATFDFVLA